MNKTSIEWVRNPDGSQGYTWNPITGCLNHVNGLCKGGNFPCYAYKLANGRLKQRYLRGRELAGIDWVEGCPVVVGQDKYEALLKAKDDPFYPRFWEEKLLKPAKGFAGYLKTKPKGIFVCNMSDPFGIGIPEEWTRRVLEQCKIFSQHRFYLLTKQPQNPIKFSPFPENCWVGATVTNQDSLSDTLRALIDVDAKTKFLSLEPLLGEINVSFYPDEIQWVIIGQQTPVSAKTEPKVEWVREIVNAADKAGIPVFLKDNLKPLLVTYKDGGEYAPLWANGGYGTLRQEIPL